MFCLSGRIGHLIGGPTRPPRQDARRRFGRVILTLLVIGLTGLPGVTDANVIYVNHDGSDANDGSSWSLAKQFIQSGVNAAVAGDEVWVAQGTYYKDNGGGVVVTTGVRLYGGFAVGDTWSDRDPATKLTIVDGRFGSGYSPAILVAPPSGPAGGLTVVDGFTILKSDNFSHPPAPAGGGVFCGSGSVRIANNTIMTSNGAGIYCSNCDVDVAGNTVTDTHSAVYFENCTGAITGNNFSSNHINGGTGGGLVVFGCDIVISDNTITDNTGSGLGGGIAIFGGPVTVSGNAILRNITSGGGEGGGLAIRDCPSAKVLGNTIGFNRARAAGGIEALRTVLEARENSITDNTATGAFAGGILALNGAEVISGNVIARNFSPDRGGGIFAQGAANTNIGLVGTSVISNNLIVDNSAGSDGGGVYVNGVYSPEPFLTNNTVVGNVVTSPSTSSFAGGIADDSGIENVANNLIAGNTNGLKGGNSTRFSHNCVFGNSGTDYVIAGPGAGDISSDPRFVAPGVGDYHLGAGSPCIDAGDDLYVTSGETDLDGNPRTNGLHVDIGAYESQDSTPPATTSTLLGPAGSNGWFTGAVQVSLSATDPEGPSDVAATYYQVDGGLTHAYSGPFSVDGDAIHSITFWSVDKAGNEEKPHNTQQIMIDGTAPTLTFGTSMPAANAAGWNNSAVDLSYTTGDNLSGVASSSPGSPLHFAAEGLNQIQTVTVTDVAGNVAAFTSTVVNIDLTAPVSTASLSGTAGNNGWYRSAVTVTLAASDALSGVAHTYYAVDGGATLTYGVPFQVTGDAIHTITYWSVDRAGNTESPQTQVIRIDSSAPIIRAVANPSALWPPNGKMVPVTISGSITDAISGVFLTGACYSVVDEYGQVQPSGPITVQPNGTFTFTVMLQASRRGDDKDGRLYTIWISALDLAGNVGSASISVVVPHDQR